MRSVPGARSLWTHANDGAVGLVVSLWKWLGMALTLKTSKMLGIIGQAKTKSIKNATEAFLKEATRWLWIKRAEPWTKLPGHKLGSDRPWLGCLGEGV